MTNVAEEGAKRSSIEKLPLREESAFERLPDEIIEHILQLTSPNGFASLIVLNSKWRMVSQQAHLYALHLSRCPSYSAAHRTTPIPDDEDSLPKLRRLFAREIKCNLFEAYLRPQETIINLVSTSISSSSAPGGEAFHFSLSPRGHYVLAYSSSRIHVIDVTGPDITVKRELKIVRRPVSTTITDDGALLAVLSTDLQVNLYDLTGEHPKRTRAVELDYSPRTIALAPMGSVLAAAYDSGVEVSSLDPDFARTERRAVKCYAADSLSFSKNGTQLLGTTTQSQNPSTVVLTAPYYDPSNLPEENVSTLWTTSILFPNGSRDCSHATLLPSPTADEASWTFTYDRVFETFRAVRIDDLRNGTTYFTGPTSDSLSKLVPSTLPTASETGDLVSAGFQGSIWLYGVPEDLEALPNNSSSTDSNVGSEPGTPSPLPRRRNSAPSLRSVDRQNSVRTPQWKLLCDRARNTFVEGRKISSLERVNAMTWVNDNYTSFHKERLVAVAPGVTSQPIQMEDDGMNPVDGGRISILDFDYSLSNGSKSVITIEVGAEEPDVLEEEHRDLDAEVALVRRRTVAQKRGTQNSVARSATAAAAAAARATARPPVPPVPNLRALGDPFTPPSPRRSSITSNDNSETVSIDEGEALDAPYSHTSPRSAPTLRRAATAAAVNRRLHPRAVAGEHIEFRRADGREEHPHESDADNWVPPPPPYTKDAVPPLPEHIQRSILAEAAAAALQRTNAQRPPNLEFLDLNARPLQRSRTTASVSSNGSRREHGPFTPSRSDSTARPIGSLSLSQGQRPVTSYTSQASPEFDDLYDVSPPGSPGPMARMAPPTPPTPLMRPSPQQPSPPSPPTRAPPAPPTPPTPLTPLALSVEQASEPNISPVSASTAPSIRNIPRRPVGTSPRNIGSSPSPSMDKKATMQQSFSPIPQPIPRPLDSRLLDWETKTTANEGPASKMRLTTPALNITEEGSDQESTPRPSEDHITRPVLRTSIQRRAVEPQPAALSKRSVTAPVMTSPSSAKQDPVPVQYRTNTAPMSIQLASSSSTSSASPQMIMPRADQLARLNSRRGRPAGVTDPRRSSGLFNQPRAVSSADNFTWNHGQHAAAPPSAEYRHQGSSSMRPNTTYLPSSRHNIPSPAVPELNRLSLSNSNVRQGLPESHLQPPMPHLETIHSVNSEPAPWVSKQMAVGVSRQPSRAERSAAKNIKDAKKRGWRGMKKDDSSKRKEKRFDVASSAGWSDVPSMPSDVRDWQDYKAKKTGKKCMVM